MLEYGLVYQGQKTKGGPKTIKLDTAGNGKIREYVFPNTAEAVWIPQMDAEWLLQHNDTLFRLVGRRPLAEPDTVAPEDFTENDLYRCDICGKTYTYKMHYTKHLEKCQAKADDADAD